MQIRWTNKKFRLGDRVIAAENHPTFGYAGIATGVVVGQCRTPECVRVRCDGLTWSGRHRSPEAYWEGYWDHLKSDD
jgi:hypothetical protein